MRVIAANENHGKFKSLNKSLTEASIDLGLALQVKKLFSSRQDQQDVQQDMQH